jgi:hypothetical protein
MSDRVRDQVEDPCAHQEIETATSLEDAANSGQSLQGYASINGLDENSEIAALAYQYFEQRQNEGLEGCAETDWCRAEEEIRRRCNPSTGR